MEKLISFFEIPAADFERAVEFYEQLLDLSMACEACETEKMGFFPSGEGAISWASNFRPSADGVLISLKVKSIDSSLKKIETLGGKIITPKTAIEVEGHGFFAVFIDSEGNRVGLHETPSQQA